MNVSVVVPTFRSPSTLPRLVERVTGCSWFTAESELIIVDDGNTDDTWRAISELAASNKQVLGLRLGRNFGQHAALDRKSTRLNSSHTDISRMPSSA